MKSLNYVIAFLVLGTTAVGQSDLLLYNFNAIPQSLHTNPAYEQQTKIWVGLPVISGVQTHYHNNGFALIDLFETGTDPNDNLSNIINSLDSKNQIAINQTTELLGIGFKAGKSFVSLGAYQQIDYKMDYPADLLRLVYFGNVDNRDLDIGNFGFESMVRTNYYLGYQRSFGEKLRLGFRFKYIIGQSHGYVDRMKAEITTTDTSSLLVNTDILVRTAGVEGLLRGEGDIDYIEAAFGNNTGYALDLGVYYRLNDHWNFSASLLDFGYVNWRSSTTENSSEGSYVFDGVSADLSSDQPIESFDAVVDSLEAAFNFQETKGVEYKRNLSSRFFLSANYQLSERHGFGVLYHGRIWDDRLFSDFSVNYQGRLARMLQLTVGYSIINGTYDNLGAGLSLKLGPVQIYAISDNVLHAIMYENLKTSNVRAGLNITIYPKKNKGKKRKKKAEHEPEEEPETES